MQVLRLREDLQQRLAVVPADVLLEERELQHAPLDGRPDLGHRDCRVQLQRDERRRLVAVQVEAPRLVAQVEGLETT